MNSITLEQAHNKVKQTYDKLEKERKVRDKVCNVMVDFEGTRLTRRVVKALETELEGFSVTYYPEKDYQRIVVRDKEDFYQIILQNGDSAEVFNYDKFVTRENSNEFLYQAMALKPYVDNEAKLAHFLCEVEVFSQALVLFKELIQDEMIVWYALKPHFKDLKLR